MPHRVSPGVFVNEFDFSDYAPALGLATLAIVGGATKGKLNTPTPITSEGDLIRIFGRPVLTDYALHAAIQFLKKGSRLLFTRIANGAVAASIPVAGTAAGTPAVKASGDIAFNASTNPTDGELIHVYDRVPSAIVENDATGVIGNVALLTSNAAVIGISGLTGGVATPVPLRATGTIKFKNGQLPVDGDTITLNDGAGGVAVFEFDDNAGVGGGNIAVAIVANDPYATMQNLVTAINNVGAPLLISAATNHVKKTFEFDDNGTIGAGNVGVLIGATAADTLLNLLTALNNNLTFATAQNSTVTVPRVTLTMNVGGVDGNAKLLTTGANITLTGFANGANAVSGAVITSATFYGLTPGTWANGLKITVEPTTIIGAPAGNFDVIIEGAVDESGFFAVVERFTNLSVNAADSRFAETIIADGVRGEVNPSQYIKIDVASNAGTISPGTYTLGGPGGVTGADGISALTAADYVGTVNGQTASGLKALKNPETTEFNILAVPGNSNAVVISEMLNLCAARGDCMAIVDPPFGLSRDEVIAWHNGTSTVANAPLVPLNTSYGALYWAWVREYDPYNKKSIFMPPSGFVAGVYAYTDKVIGPWMAPAGHNRGLITGLEVEYSPQLAERDMLVGGQNRVNPIVNFANTGLTVFGNRTLQRKPTALDSVHVRRMLLYAEKLCATAVQYLVFEPNDPVTWRRFVNLVNPILEHIKANRGLEEFKVICDATTNPAFQRQNKTMKGKILLKAIDAAEIIEIDFALFATGAEFSSDLF